MGCIFAGVPPIFDDTSSKAYLLTMNLISVNLQWYGMFISIQHCILITETVHVELFFTFDFVGRAAIVRVCEEIGKIFS